MATHNIARRKILYCFWGLLIASSVSILMLVEWSTKDKRRIAFSIKTVAKCTEPHQNIMFLKTHKTGSSSFTNVLNRFADENNLTVVLPRNTMYSFSWPKKFQFQNIGNLEGKPNVLSNHARYNKPTLNLLFPKESSKYVTLIREPVAHYESVFYFFRFHYSTGHATISEFLDKKMPYPQWKRIRKRSPAFSLSRNPLMFDLGFDLKFYENRAAINEYIRFLDQEFDLVMVLEHFDESLVLLKRLFCWNIQDLLYFRQVQRTRDDKNNEHLTNDVKSKIRKWNEADAMLYEYFNSTLWERIRMEGPDFYKDLNLFRQELRRVKNTCLSNRRKKTKAYTGKYVVGYQLKENIPTNMRSRCAKMLKNEIHYVDYFRNKTVPVEEQGWDVKANEHDVYRSHDKMG